MLELCRLLLIFLLNPPGLRRFLPDAVLLLLLLYIFGWVKARNCSAIFSETNIQICNEELNEGREGVLLVGGGGGGGGIPRRGLSGSKEKKVVPYRIK